MLIEELKKIEDTLFKVTNHTINNVLKELECEDYQGYNFQLGSLKIKYRKAKITPKKVGLFVTLWKRNEHNETIPFHIDDQFDFYLIVCEQDHQFGFFLFPKQLLSDKKIVSSHFYEGKRGFRIYPDWCETENKQATKTKDWQKDYFINFSNQEANNLKHFHALLHND